MRPQNADCGIQNPEYRLRNTSQRVPNAGCILREEISVCALLKNNAAACVTGTSGLADSCPPPLTGIGTVTGRHFLPLQRSTAMVLRQGKDNRRITGKALLTKISFTGKVSPRDSECIAENVAFAGETNPGEWIQCQWIQCHRWTKPSRLVVVSVRAPYSRFRSGLRSGA